MKLHIEVHAPSHGCAVLATICDIDSGLQLIYTHVDGKWTALGGLTSKNGAFHPYMQGGDYLLPISVEGDLNRARDAAVKKASTHGYATITKEL